MHRASGHRRAWKWKWKALSCVQLFASTRLLCPWNSLGKNTGVGSHSLLQGIFPIQGSTRSPALQEDSLPFEPLAPAKITLALGKTCSWVPNIHPWCLQNPQKSQQCGQMVEASPEEFQKQHQMRRGQKGSFPHQIAAPCKTKPLGPTYICCHNLSCYQSSCVAFVSEGIGIPGCKGITASLIIHQWMKVGDKHIEVSFTLKSISTFLGHPGLICKMPPNCILTPDSTPDSIAFILTSCRIHQFSH